MQKVSIFDCIERIPWLTEAILKNREQTFAALFAKAGEEVSGWEEIIFIGSGTSNTCAETSRFFVEKVTKIKTSAVYPDDFYYNTYVYNPKALYVFTSQTGTSTTVRKAQQKMQALGHLTVAVSESPDTPLAREAAVFVDMGCGVEEYLTRTIGYAASVFTHMLLGLEIAKRRGSVSAEEYEAYIRLAAALPQNQRDAVPAANRWMEKTRRSMLRSRCLLFVGADALQGVALEAAVKVWEIPQIIAAGYELEESLHGPNFGYDHNHCVIVLNNGGREDQKALALARWMKDVYQNGWVIGASVAGEDDLKLDVTCGDFGCLAITPAVQILACRLAEAQGRDLFAPHDNSVMDSYFKTHG